MKVADDGKWLPHAVPSSRIPANVEFGVLFVSEKNVVRAIGYVPQRDPAGRVIGLLGFVARATQYAGTLFSFLWHSPRILPAALTRGIPNDSLLVASVSTPEGVEIYRSRAWERTLLSDTASLASFAGRLRVRVALRRDAMAKLGGGLIPASRVPVWVGLLLLTALLTAIILRNLQREHELARLRADFTASVSHELRTPLAQILLFGETLTLGRTRSESERTRAAEVIVREARRLMQLAENALQFSRSSQPGVELSPERTHLASSIREIIATFEPLGDTRGVRIIPDLSEDPIASVDRSAFRQMVINLLDNALKYGPPEQTITVGLTGSMSQPALTPDRNGERRVARIWVEDEGPGIAPALRDRIFIPFIRGEGDATTGCGLGLAVVRDLVIKHDGKVWVETASNGIGSRFVIELPIVAQTVTSIALINGERTTVR
jgi:signal transduction histidine kinase